MSAHQHNDEDPLDSAPALSGEAVTPRGGFMARPGLKTPPRHAVVVRGGDAPDSEEIPKLRSSLPPPPPSDEPAPPSNADKITLRAIPTSQPPRASQPAPAAVAVMPAPPAAMESLPPPSQGPLSDAPLIASVPPPPARMKSSRWTIVAAAAAGLVLGLVSVGVKVRSQGAAAQPQPVATLPALPSVVAKAPALAPSSRAWPAAVKPAPVVSAQEPKASRPAPPSAKRSIF